MSKDSTSGILTNTDLGKAGDSMWDELTYYGECRDEAEEDFYLELAENANRYYNPDLVEE